VPVLELVPIVTAANKVSSLDLTPSSDHMMCFHYVGLLHKGHVDGVLDGEALDWLHNRLSNDYKLSMY
jgi:hypothetical protein